MTTVWIKIIRNTETGMREVFRTMHGNWTGDWKPSPLVDLCRIERIICICKSGRTPSGNGCLDEKCYALLESIAF